MGCFWLRPPQCSSMPYCAAEASSAKEINMNNAPAGRGDRFVLLPTIPIGQSRKYTPPKRNEKLLLCPTAKRKLKIVSKSPNGPMFCFLRRRGTVFFIWFLVLVWALGCNLKPSCLPSSSGEQRVYACSKKGIDIFLNSPFWHVSGRFERARCAVGWPQKFNPNRRRRNANLLSSYLQGSKVGHTENMRNERREKTACQHAQEERKNVIGFWAIGTAGMGLVLLNINFSEKG